MKDYSSYEIQDISSNFRNVARRLSCTDYSQCDSNLKRFMATLKSEELILKFIEQKNTIKYDIQEIIKARKWLSPFEVSPEQNEETSFSVQLLTYAVEVFNGDFTNLYGKFNYTSAQSTVNDEMRKFIEHIIDPLIDHVSEYLRHCYEETIRREGTQKVVTSNFTAQNSTVVIGSHIEGDISNNFSITENEKADVNEIITAIREALNQENIPNKDEIEDILQQIKSDVDADKKPRKSFLTALKVLCQVGDKVVTLVTALINLFA